MNLDLHALRDDLEALLLELGALVRRGYLDGDKDVTTKATPNDLLTKYDLEVNTRIIEHLTTRYPDISIITEEAPAIEKASDYAFLVDPIDGTRNFVHGVPAFHIGVSLAHQHKTILTLTLNPITEEMFWAIKGEGAFRNGVRLEVTRRPLESSDIQIRSYPKVAEAIPAVRYFMERNIWVRNDLASHYEMAGLAMGRFDGIISWGSSPWDYSQYLLITEAGGMVTDEKGEPYDLTRKYFLASNGVIHQDLIAACTMS